MNLTEIFTDAIKPLLDGEKPPLNVGEAMNLWFYLLATEQSMRGEQVSYNTVHDDELRQKLKDLIKNVHEPMYRELSDFIASEGVPLPQGTPSKPLGDFRSIPEGGRLSDEEVANLVVFNLVLGINYACRGITESVRADVAAMFARFLMKKVAFSITFKDLLARRGWLRTPPPYPAAQPQPAP